MESSQIPPAPGPAQKPGNWFTRLPTWAKWTIGIVGAFLLMGIGGAIASGEKEEDKLKDEIASLESDLTEVEAENEELLAEQDEAVTDAEAEAERIVDDARNEADELDGSISEAKQELQAAEGELSDVRGEIGGEEERVAKGKIPDGVWELEADYLPGTYKSPGGAGCYWALLSEPPSGGLDAIIENGGFNDNQILTIEAPYFETSGCGTWELSE